MKPLYIRVVTGYRKNQGFTLNAEEAHKAYYLFLNPDQRGIFSNGVAVQGKDIKTIEPDYNATMGWNETYEPNEYDHRQLEENGVKKKLRNALAKANLLAKDNKGLNEPMSGAVKLLPNQGESFSAGLIDKSA